MKFMCALVVLSLGFWPKVGPKSEIAKNAQAFLETLDRDQLRNAALPVDSPERTQWNYVPGPRKGVAWKDMTEPQRTAAMELLKAALSKEGFDKIQAIRGLEPVLAEMEGGNKERDPERYWLVFFGMPSDDTPWAWRYEGHHISLTFASKSGLVVSSTPQFLGSNPAQVGIGEKKGLRVLGREQDLGFKLVEALKPEQRKLAMIAETAPADIVTSTARKASIEGHQGLAYSQMDAGQRALLRELITAHASVQSKAEQTRRMSTIAKEGFDKVVFAWMGPVSRAGRHYYRIQGQSFLIEYDNTQADGNHIHTVWRDLEHDFGEDALAEHYARSHPAP